MNQEAKTAITRARTALIIDAPFFGALLMRLNMVQDDTIPTLAVDGKTIFYNPKFFLSLSADLMKSALCHEVIHCIYEHIARRGARDPYKWNIAIDYVTNELLKESNFPLDDGWLYNAAYKGMTADHIYSLLPDPPQDGGSSYGGKNQPLCDARMGENNAADQSECEVMATEWKVAAMSAAAAAKAAGKLPSSIERFVENVATPKVDWRSQLRNMMTEVAKDDYNWSRPNRRMVPYGFILPSLYSESFGTMVVVSDDSGSIDGPVLDAFSAEINAIRDSVMPRKTVHMSCDARVNHYQEYEGSEHFTMVSKGGGGTDFRPPFTRVEDENLEPRCLVYLTDGYGPFPSAPPNYRVIWCMTTDVQPPWGDVVRIQI